jgi:uncharacterized protein YggE
MWAGQAAAQAPLPEPLPAFVEVSAEAEARVQPEVATLEFGVVSRAASAAAAARENAVRMQSVMAAVRKLIDARATLGTGAYSLRTEFSPSRDGSEPRIVGYVASNGVRLETPDIARIGEIVDAAIAAGANQVQRVGFGLGDPSQARQAALRDAVRMARADAEAIASALGAKLGPVLTAVHHDTGPVRPFMQEAVAVRAAAATPIEPGHVSVRARVTLRLRLDP